MGKNKEKMWGANGIDAAIKWSDKYAYFFSGKEYLKYEIKSDGSSFPVGEPVPGYPKLINAKDAWNWPDDCLASFDCQ